MRARKKSSEPIPRVCLTLDDTCVAIGLGRDTVRQLIISGELASIRIGRRRVVPLASINKFVARLESDAEMQASGR